MGKAAELARAALPQMARVAALRDRLEKGILESIPKTRVNGRTDLRLPNTTNIGFYQLEAEAILLLLSEQGVYASAAPRAAVAASSPRRCSRRCASTSASPTAPCASACRALRPTRK
jgi:cysteine desulfurase